MAQQLIWTIQTAGFGAKREFATKREAVKAMEADRQPKTPIHRVGRAYTYTVKAS